MSTISLFSILILVFSVVAHELAHGYVALALGDPTAKYAGRLTLNPWRHLDFMGSIIVPLILSLLPGGLVFGWAKPVPYNPYNLRHHYGEALVAGAGPAINLFIAIIFGTLLRFQVFGLLEPGALWLIEIIIFTNIVLAGFNLLPVPPFDGSKILFACLPKRLLTLRHFLEKNQLILLLLVVILSGSLLSVVSNTAFFLFTGKFFGL